MLIQLNSYDTVKAVLMSPVESPQFVSQAKSSKNLMIICHWATTKNLFITRNKKKHILKLLEYK